MQLRSLFSRASVKPTSVGQPSDSPDGRRNFQAKSALLLLVSLLATLLVTPLALAEDKYEAEALPFSSQLRGEEQADNWTSWGHDVLNTRYNPFATEIKPGNVDKLKLKWAFVFPGATAASSQPAILGDTLYVGSWNAKFYALNSKTGQVQWSYDTASFTGALPAGANAVRNGPAIAGGKVYFGDLAGNIYALDARTGAFKWAKKLDNHPTVRLTSSPLVWQGRLYIGVSSAETGFALDPRYECCSFQGSMVALNAESGAEIWRYRTISEPNSPTGTNSAGTTQRGPSGAPVWSSPAIDPLLGLVYFGTGQNYSNPPTTHSDSLIALELATGKQRWATQLTPNDRWNLACNPELFGLPAVPQANCPLPLKDNNDFDFGSSPNVFLAFKDGKLRTLVGAGQKSGIYHSLDAATGEIVWQTQVSLGGVGGSGGIQWGTSWDGVHLYVATHQANPGSLNALDPATGRIVWTSKNPADGCTTGGGAGDPDCRLAMPAATTSIPGLVFEGSWDGKLRAYNARDGKIAWQYDTRQNFTGTNGLTGRGGSINGAGVSVTNGLLYVNSGYQPFPLAGMAGNVLLAFAVK